MTAAEWAALSRSPSTAAASVEGFTRSIPSRYPTGFGGHPIDYLIKPVHGQQLVQAVRSATGQEHAQVTEQQNDAV
jgi:hypothetical protein